MRRTERRGNRGGAIDYCQYATRGACIRMEGLAWKNTPTALCILCPALLRGPGVLLPALVHANSEFLNLTGNFSGLRHVEWRLEDIHISLHVCTGRLACVRLCLAEDKVR